MSGNHHFSTLSGSNLPVQLPHRSLASRLADCVTTIFQLIGDSDHRRKIWSRSQTINRRPRLIQTTQISMIEGFPPLKMIASKKRIINQFWVVSNRKRGRNQSKPTKHPTRCRKITRFQSISWIFKGFSWDFIRVLHFLNQALTRKSAASSVGSSSSMLQKEATWKLWIATYSDHGSL